MKKTVVIILTLFLLITFSFVQASLLGCNGGGGVATGNEAPPPPQPVCIHCGYAQGQKTPCAIPFGTSMCSVHVAECCAPGVSCTYRSAPAPAQQGGCQGN